jgi:hypothetical protein
VLNLDYLVPIAILSVIAYFVYRFIKHGGWRGALYGSTVVKTFGDLQLPGQAGSTISLRVHVLEDGRIILEQSARALLAASVNGISMGVLDADQLIKLLQQARDA